MLSYALFNNPVVILAKPAAMHPVGKIDCEVDELICPSMPGKERPSTDNSLLSS
jgi:hypothetical protein